MNKGLWFNELLIKVVTYEGMYYTIGKHSKEELEDIKRQWEEQEKNSISYDEVIDETIKQDLINVLLNSDEILGAVFSSDEGLIYLPYENKLLNRKEIKESLIQYI